MARRGVVVGRNGVRHDCMGFTLDGVDAAVGSEGYYYQ